MAAFLEQAIHKLISGIATTYPLIAPQTQLAPFITYQRITGSGFDDLKGPTGLERAVIQIDVYSEEFEQTKTLSRSVQDILRGYQGNVDVGGEIVKIGSCTKQSSRDFFENTAEPKLFRSSVDYRFIYSENP